MTVPHPSLSFAVQLARSGERALALELLRKITTETPEDADAWLWVSELSTRLDDQVAALEQAAHCDALQNRPPQALQERLNAIRDAMTLPAPSTPEGRPASAHPIEAAPRSRFETHRAEETFRQAERLAILGSAQAASTMLRGLLEQQPDHAGARALLRELEHSPTPTEAPGPVLSARVQEEKRRSLPVQRVARWFSDRMR